MDAPPVQYVRSTDGTRIAFSVEGQGRPLVFLPVPLSSMERSWHSPRLRPWLEALAGCFRLVCYDARSQGLSERRVLDYSIAAHVGDLTTVVERIGLGQFVLLGSAGFGHVAARYALANPTAVQALIFVSTPVSGQSWSESMYEMLVNEDWELFLNSQIPPGLSLEEARAELESLRRNNSPEAFWAGCKVARQSSIEDILPQLHLPALVIHARDHLALRPGESSRLTASISDGRLALIDGADAFGDVGQGMRAITEFLEALPRREQGAVPSSPGRDSVISTRELEVLRLIAAGKSNQQIADELVVSSSTVAKHLNAIFAKLNLANRTEAAAYAHRNWLV
jgi:pimeloyl-ACP methyl ester carboxylesterase/DNA-binding CsgD family transcriptional regulator